MGIPVIDLTGALARGGPRSEEVAREFRAAAMASGFFYVRHHGIDGAMVERQFDIARRLMAANHPCVKAGYQTYGPSQEGADERTFGAGAHTDWGQTVTEGAA